jgi:uncharacterized lipoprotein YbaY
MPSQPIVTGTIEFDAAVDAFVSATLRVFLEDVGMMDAPAKHIAEHIDHNFTYSGGKVPFQIYGSISHPTSRYSVRVHVSRDGSSDIQKGDFISTQSYPVLTHGNPAQVAIKVQQV